MFPIPFIAAKLLSFLPFGNLLRGTSGKLILVGLAAAAVAFLVWKWKDNIRNEAYDAIFSRQAEEVIKEQKKEFEKLQKAIESSRQIERNVLEKRQKLTVETEELIKEIRQANAEDDGPVAPVLKMSVEFIRDREATKKGTKTVVDKAIDVTKKAVEATGKAVDKAGESGNSVIDAWKKGLANE